MTAEELHQQWKAQTQQDALPETAQRAVLGRIDSLCFSIRKKSKRNKILAGVIAGIVVVACAVVGIVLGVNHASAAPDYYADIQIQDYGTVTVELDADAAPITVENFVNLARSGFYDGLTFHRIMDGFMMQGGDPEGNGTGGSDTTIKGEFSANGVENNLSHTRGAISMARSSDYDSASSQFFIVQEDSTFLDGQYACFGYVTEGMDIVDEICESAQPTDDNGTIPADEQPVITSITIREGE
ncbi:MAG TPA: peptidylprolyl isomerase [Candidatus Egerieicola pullicola]|uniref:Peptidyl-prolyl cis-trans isomerase n=1 Tax=Candidatus Egerieicola pullicola TaxID=2840775 RepID=A0A9D1AJW2_9FIRM|nr:peptidylprolyl isomerase [Candidatus Egerieicola pullicola]